MMFGSRHWEGLSHPFCCFLIVACCHFAEHCRWALPFSGHFLSSPLVICVIVCCVLVMFGHAIILLRHIMTKNDKRDEQ